MVRARLGAPVGVGALRRRWLAFPFAAAALVAPPFAHAQAPADTLVPAGAEYQMHGPLGGLRRWFYGSRYRSLWATPVAAPLAPFAAGAVEEPRDTTLHLDGLWLWTPEGSVWQYRPLDRDLYSATPQVIRQNLIPSVIQGFNPARHPGAAPVVEALAAVVGIRVPASGQARLGFDLEVRDGNGRLGYLEEVPIAGRTTSDLLDSLRARGGQALDARAYLRERLFDTYLGSWDESPDGWRWIRADSHATWVPGPRGRERAFAKYDGVLAGMARGDVPGFVDWGPDYQDRLGVMPYQLTLDRQLLATLDWPVWDSLSLAMQRELDDTAIARAVAALPPAYQAADSGRLAVALRARRDGLPGAARRLYSLANQEAALFGGPGADTVTVTRHENGGMVVQFAGGLRRTFEPGEADAVALYLQGGDDRVVLLGPGDAGPRLDLAWHPGLTVVGSRQSGLYTTVYGGRLPKNRLGLTYTADSLPVPEVQDLDLARPKPVPLHGTELSPVAWLDINSDVGILLGGGVALTSYRLGFEPFRSRAVIKSGYATATGNYAIEFHGEFTRWRSPVTMSVDAGLSEIAVLHFFGYGNTTPFTGSADFYLAQQKQLYLYPAWNYRIGPKSVFTIGPSYKHVFTDTLTASYINLTRPYGTPEFAQAGVLATAVYDTRDADDFTRHGLRVTAGGSYYPFLFGDGTPFGTMSASVASYVTLRTLPTLTLATRVTGRLTMGDAPVHEAAFAGGSNSIRGYESNRYAGEAAAYFNGELRWKVATVPVVVPWEFGVVGIGDVGRVFNEGDDPSVWHASGGGGIWFAMPDRSLGGVLTVVGSPQGTSLWLSYRFMY